MKLALPPSKAAVAHAVAFLFTSGRMGAEAALGLRATAQAQQGGQAEARQGSARVEWGPQGPGPVPASQQEGLSLMAAALCTRGLLQHEAGKNCEVRGQLWCMVQHQDLISPCKGSSILLSQYKNCLCHLSAHDAFPL